MAKFITPDLMKNKMTEGLERLNISTANVDAYISDLFASSNTSEQLEMFYKFEKYVPEDLPVMLLPNLNTLSRKYGFPENPPFAAAIGPDMDTRYKMILMVNVYQMTSHILRHEIIHYNQIKNKNLSNDGEKYIWSKDGQEFILDITEDSRKRIEIGSNLEGFLYHELQKPWEVEAYGQTMTDREYNNISQRCKDIIDNYRNKYM